MGSPAELPNPEFRRLAQASGSKRLRSGRGYRTSNGGAIRLEVTGSRLNNAQRRTRLFRHLSKSPYGQVVRGSSTAPSAGSDRRSS